MNIIIIGSGPAGITAGYELAKRSDNKVTILESTDRVGGISQTVNHNGNRMDIGGHRFFSKSDRVTSWWYEILAPQGAPSIDDKLLNRSKSYDKDGKDPELCDEVMLKRHRVSRIYYKNKFFDYPVSLKAQTILNMGFATTVSAGCSYLRSTVHKLPDTSLENFYINRFGKKLYSMFFEGYTEKVWGRHPSKISADWGSQRVKGLSITAVIKDIFGKISGNNKTTETSLIEEFYYPKFGPGHLWETALKRATENGVNFISEANVTKINADGDKVTGVTYVKDGKEISLNADIVISTMPIKDLAVALTDDTPKDVFDAMANLPYRDFITVGLLADKLNLVNNTDIKNFNNLVPDCWIYVQDTGVKLGRIQIFNNWSPYMVKDVQNTVWIGLEYFCNEGDKMWNTPNDEFIAFATSELEKIGVISKGSVLDSHIEHIKKAYPAYFDSYAQMDEIRTYLNKFNNLFCIGRNGQHRYNNMDHSMLTAFEAVDEILSSKDGIYNKEKIWSVNAEDEYHEQK